MRQRKIKISAFASLNLFCNYYAQCNVAFPKHLQYVLITFQPENLNHESFEAEDVAHKRMIFFNIDEPYLKLPRVGEWFWSYIW